MSIQVVKEENLKFCVSIYPGGIETGKNVPTFVNFPGPEVKERYVTAESLFCKRQFAIYDGLISKEERFKARRKLEKCRVEFAKSQGYAPDKNARGKIIDKEEWYFKGKDEPTEVA